MSSDSLGETTYNAELVALYTVELLLDSALYKVTIDIDIDTYTWILKWCKW